DERDFEFAKKYDIPLRNALLPEDESLAEKPNGILQTPECVKGMKWYEAREGVIDYIEENGLGRRAVNYKLRDWLFSRQRYWGEPIPVVHWENGTHTAVDESELPLELPSVEEYKPSDDGESPLARAGEWLDVVSKDGRKGRRETNTMPQWAGSCWYYLRFLDPKNTESLCDSELEKKGMSVDLYIGGAEHAVLHLLYSRFWHKVLFDLDVVSTNEPFKKLFNQGMLVERITAKMSKSLKNVVNPDDVISEYGADTLRMFLMFLGPLESTKPWDSKAIAGIDRFIKKFWNLIVSANESGFLSSSEEEKISVASCVKKVGDSTESIRYNTAISALMQCVNELSGKSLSKESAKSLLILISPYAPHLSEELWELIGEKESISKSNWPTFDESLLIKSSVDLVIQIKGKKRALINTPVDSSDSDIKLNVIEAMKDTQYAVLEASKFIIVRDKKTKFPKLVNILI
ncbi:UNVERIFIED_CONTAM: hypothetical protein GTU68_006296, partial [Idotea baltica]|nr:hypothetical protein [Idotea baltica]